MPNNKATTLINTDNAATIDMSVESIVAARNHKGYVIMRMTLAENVISTQMDPVQARRIGRWLMETAEAAEQDSFMLRFLMAKVGTTIEAAGSLLLEFRKDREVEEKADAAD